MILLFAMLASSAPLDLSAWKYRKRIPLTPGDGLAVVKLDREVYFHARESLADVRVIHEGDEVPWVMHFPMTERVNERHAPPILTDKGVVEGRGVQFTLTASGPHDRVSVGTDKRNFRQTVMVEASQNGEQWAVLRSDSSIFDFSQDGRVMSSLEVPYPTSTRRFLRVTVLGWMEVAAVTGASLGLGSGHVEYKLEPLSTIIPTVTEDSATQSTVLTLDQGAAGLPIDRLELTSTTPMFHRGVFLELSDDGQHWFGGRNGFIRRVHNDDFSEESMSVQVYEQVYSGSRYQRIRIYNGDDKPLQIGPIQSMGRPRLVKFRAPEKGEYWLYYGNPSAVKQPRYDMFETLSSTEKLMQTAILAGPGELNPTYHPPPPPKKPWSEQHPGILYTVLGGAVLALGVATFRFASRLRPNAS